MKNSLGTTTRRPEIRNIPRTRDEGKRHLEMIKYLRHQSGLLIAALAFIGTVSPTPSPAQADDPFTAVLADHRSRYPLMTLDDLYKLIHQASMGSEHAVTDTASAREWLSREIAQLGEGPDEPILHPLTPDSGIVRVHLRPFLEAGGDPEALLDAFIRTANLYAGSLQELKRRWSVALRMAEEGSLAFGPSSMKEYLAAKEAEGFPAIHHSGAYAAAYRPAYRVVARPFLPPGLMP